MTASPDYKTGKILLATILDPAGNLLGIDQQPGLAEAEAET